MEPYGPALRGVIDVLRSKTRSRLDRADREVLAAKLESLLSEKVLRCEKCGGCNTPNMPASCECGEPQWALPSAEGLREAAIEPTLENIARAADFINAVLKDHNIMCLEAKLLPGRIRALRSATGERIPSPSATASGQFLTEVCDELFGCFIQYLGEQLWRGVALK